LFSFGSRCFARGNIQLLLEKQNTNSERIAKRTREDTKNIAYDRRKAQKICGNGKGSLGEIILELFNF
jgi:hypothetical protein